MENKDSLKDFLETNGGSGQKITDSLPEAMELIFDWIDRYTKVSNGELYHNFLKNDVMSEKMMKKALKKLLDEKKIFIEGKVLSEKKTWYKTTSGATNEEYLKHKRLLNAIKSAEEILKNIRNKNKNITTK
jgi:hypothetical protein